MYLFVSVHKPYYILSLQCRFLIICFPKFLCVHIMSVSGYGLFSKWPPHCVRCTFFIFCDCWIVVSTTNIEITHNHPLFYLAGIVLIGSCNIGRYVIISSQAFYLHSCYAKRDSSKTFDCRFT